MIKESNASKLNDFFLNYDSYLLREDGHLSKIETW